MEKLKTTDQNFGTSTDMADWKQQSLAHTCLVTFVVMLAATMTDNILEIITTDVGVASTAQSLLPRANISNQILMPRTLQGAKSRFFVYPLRK